MSVCLFTGHRDLPPAHLEELKALLEEAVSRLWAVGVTEYLCGGAMGFDLLAGEAVLALRDRCPGLRLHLVLPCENQDKNYSAADRQRYRVLREQADKITCLSPIYYQGCMLARDRWMVDHGDLCICYLTHSGGGTAYTVREAVKKSMDLYNLATRLKKE